MILEVAAGVILGGLILFFLYVAATSKAFKNAFLTFIGGLIGIAIGLGGLILLVWFISGIDDRTEIDVWYWFGVTWLSLFGIMVCWAVYWTITEKVLRNRKIKARDL